MKILKTALGILRQTCIIFTAIIILFYLIANANSGMTLVLEMSGMFILLLLSLILALANQIFAVKRIPAVLRALLHYLVVTATLILAFFYYGGETSSVRTALILAFSLAVLYAIVTAAVMAVLIRLRAKRSDATDYRPQFAEITRETKKRK